MLCWACRPHPCLPLIVFPAAVIPLFLVVMFEVAYAVHKRRSVKFCGIVFDVSFLDKSISSAAHIRSFLCIVWMMKILCGRRYPSPLFRSDFLTNMVSTARPDCAD